MTTSVVELGRQLIYLLILSIPIASIAWTVTHEEVFREPREFCIAKSTTCRNIFERKLFYLFTCEYCFSHYVAAGFLVLTRYKLMFDDWRGYLIAEFALVWVANVLMGLFAKLRVEIKAERFEITTAEAAAKQKE